MAKAPRERDVGSLGFEEPQSAYESPSQIARVLTESWAQGWLYCPNCGQDDVERFQNNWPVSDFYCVRCAEQYELKSKKGKFGRKVIDGAYRTMLERLASDVNPNFAFLSYNLQRRSVVNLFIIPKQFVVPALIEERRPLPPTARRAGWVGCNIQLSRIPNLGKVDIVKDGLPLPKDHVLEQWNKSLFLRSKNVEARGWLLEVMTCCEAIGRTDFELSDVYAHEQRLRQLYPQNRHVKEKIRQQLQVLRDAGYLDFIGRGRYRLR